MKKHGAVLDMRNNRLFFWLGHYQHDVALRPHAEEAHEESNVEAPHAEKPCTKPRAEELHAVLPMKILKRQSNELPELLPYLLSSTQGVSKVTSTSTPNRRSTHQKNEPIIMPQKPKPSVESANKTNKPLDLALIGGAPFMHLAKSKKQKAEIFAISMRDIEYQLNKGIKPLTNPKTVVQEEYHDFLDVFSKGISDTLKPYGKYDHKIELLKDKDLSDFEHSAL